MDREKGNFARPRSVRVFCGCSSKVFMIVIFGLSSMGASSCKDDSLTPLEPMNFRAPPKKINIHVNGYCPGINRVFSNFMVWNRSIIIENGFIKEDLDRDGLTNEIENQTASEFNISRFSNDTNNDCYSDLLMFISGINPSEQNNLVDCRAALGSAGALCGPDTDRDGLTDCEEQFIARTDYRNWDSDSDGISDLHEIRFGTNPSASGDAKQDIDLDGLINSEEVRFNTPIDESNRGFNTEFSPKYDIESFERDPDNGDRTTCYNLKFNNIALIEAFNSDHVELYIYDEEIDSGDPMDLPERFQRTAIVRIPKSVKANSTLVYDYGVGTGREITPLTNPIILFTQNEN